MVPAPTTWKDDGHGARLTVKAGDGQGDAFGVLLRADNDKLAGLRLFGDERRMDPELGHGGVEFPPFDDSKQSDLSFSLLFYKVGAYIVAYFPGNVKKKVKTNKQEKTGKREYGGKFRRGEGTPPYARIFKRGRRAAGPLAAVAVCGGGKLRAGHARPLQMAGRVGGNECRGRALFRQKQKNETATAPSRFF